MFLDGYPGASTYAIRKGFRDVGVDDNEILIFSELLGSESVFLTANADTEHLFGFVDLTSGPDGSSRRLQMLGAFDDMWWGWIQRFQACLRPRRGEGGRFLIVPPGYRGPLPDSGFHVGHSRTTRALIAGRSLVDHDDPAPTIKTIEGTVED